MSATREAVIESALKKIKEIYSDTSATFVLESKKLDEFPGRGGFLVWVQVNDDLFGTVERTIEVDGETLEARIPYHM